VHIRQTSQFKKDVKRSKKRNKNFSAFKVVIEYLVQKKELPEKYEDHQLIDNYQEARECHIEPDWLLIYRIEGDVLILIRLGTHSDLFS